MKKTADLGLGHEEHPLLGRRVRASLHADLTGQKDPGIRSALH